MGVERRGMTRKELRPLHYNIPPPGWPGLMVEIVEHFLAVLHSHINVMAGLVPAIHVLLCDQSVDARHKAGHGDLQGCPKTKPPPGGAAVCN
jgi:hypothetical protein